MVSLSVEHAGGAKAGTGRATSPSKAAFPQRGPGSGSPLRKQRTLSDTGDARDAREKDDVANTISATDLLRTQQANARCKTMARLWTAGTVRGDMTRRVGVNGGSVLPPKRTTVWGLPLVMYLQECTSTLASPRCCTPLHGGTSPRLLCSHKATSHTAHGATGRLAPRPRCVRPAHAARRRVFR